MLPRIRITDLLSEVARWTLFTDCFTHLRTGETAADPQILMASLLADGLNLGLTRMAEACSIASLGQLAWTADWHIRDETYALALRRLIDQQQREPLAAMFAASIHTGIVAASLILRQLASYPRQNGLAAALRELGRLERTLFTLDWLEDAELRRQTSQELNKGETRNSLARAVFIHRLGEIRDRTYENQQHRASGLNLLVTAIIRWNTRYLERAVAALRQAKDAPDQLLAHLSPLGWEHVNLSGDYIWSAEPPDTQNPEDSTRSERRPIPLARPPEFVVCPPMCEIRVFRYFWPSQDPSAVCHLQPRSR
jgi:hypothetical protein